MSITNRYFINCLVASLFTMITGASFAQMPPGKSAGPALKITVYVYNPAKVPAMMLEQARQEVVRIYRAAGVETEWVDCPCVTEELDNYPRCRLNPSRQDWVAVQVISRAMLGGLRLDPAEFGLAALREEGGFGNRALVCAQCAEHAVKGKPLMEGRADARGTILGDLMAHELGHLLQATMRHSSFGVMRPHWNRADLEDAARGRMFFTAKQAQRIGAQVRDRMRQDFATARVKD